MSKLPRRILNALYKVLDRALDQCGHGRAPLHCKYPHAWLWLAEGHQLKMRRRVGLPDNPLLRIISIIVIYIIWSSSVQEQATAIWGYDASPLVARVTVIVADKAQTSGIFRDIWGDKRLQRYYFLTSNVIFDSNQPFTPHHGLAGTTHHWPSSSSG